MSNKSQWRTARTILCSFVLAVSVPRAFAQAEILGHEAYSRVAAQSRIGIWLGGNLAECEVPYVEQSDAWSSSLQNGPQTCGPVESYPGLSAMTDGGVTSVVSASATVITLNVNADGSAATIQPDPGYQLAFARADSVGGAWVEFRLRSSAYVTITYSIEAQFAADAGGWGSAGGCSAYVSAPFVYEGVNSNEEQSQSLGPILLTPDTYGAAASIHVNVSRDGYLGGATGTNTGGGSAQLTLSFTPVFGGCCFGSGNCLMLTLEDCLAQGGSYSGDEIPCESLSCRGACCLPSGNCVETSPTQCTLSNGRYWGDGVDCSLVRCLGACCVPTGGCELTSRAECEQLEGTFHGEGTYCDFEYCPPVISIETTPLLTCPLTTARFRAIPSCGTPDEWWDFHWMRYSPQGWRWLEDDDRVSGSYSDTLQIENLRRSDAGYYRVAAYGWCGSVTSQDILLRFKGDNLENPADNADGDGSPDCWETEGAGMDVNDDGIRDLDLYAAGARPDHKDLFVEIDGMQFIDINSYRPALAEVVRAFDQAPVDNPDGTTGIHLFLEYNPLDIPYEPETEVWCSGYPRRGSEWKAQYFGSPAQQADVNWEHIRTAKLRTHRWCLLLSSPSTGGLFCLNSVNGILGVAELPGDDFAVYVDQMSRRPLVVNADQHALIPYLVAETFMHELGHTLGLRHGGLDDINGKPNYRSVMNYTACLTFDRFLNENIQPMDYSRRRLNALFEYDLSETIGIAGGVEYDLWTMPFAFTIDGTRQYRFVRLNGQAIDFGSLDDSLTPDDQITNHARQDLNYFGTNSANGAEEPSPNQELISHDDWNNLRYDIAASSELAAFTEPPAEDEPTFERTQWRLAWPTIHADCQTQDVPRILGWPQEVTIASGEPFELDVEATGTAPLTYQWVKDGAALVGATSAEFHVGFATLANAGKYKVWVNNGCGGAESAVVTVTVLAPPGDLDLDGDVDLQDLAALLAAFGSCTGDLDFNQSADIVADGCIDLLDLTQLLSQFGQW